MTDQLLEQQPSLEQVETLSELLRIGKDEMNLAEFPMTSLSERPIKGETTLKFEDQIFDDRKRKIILRKRIIEGSKQYGLPTATDDAVILALIQLTKLKNTFSCRELEFTRHELITLLNWPNKGQSYDRIALSLHRLAAVTYHFENSWWDNRRKAWTSKIFGIIDNVDLNDSRETDGQGVLFSSRIVWNQTVLDSFQAGYLRSIDFQLALSFKHIISMRIYRFIGTDHEERAIIDHLGRATQRTSYLVYFPQERAKFVSISVLLPDRMAGVGRS
jgi:Replication initiator protein A